MNCNLRNAPTLVKRAIVIEKAATGMTNAQIVSATKIPATTVRRLRKEDLLATRAKKASTTTTAKKKAMGIRVGLVVLAAKKQKVLTGSKEVGGCRSKRTIFRRIKVPAFPTPSAISRHLFLQYKIKASPSTVRRDLQAAGWRAYKATCGPSLSTDDKLNRRHFCRSMRNFNTNSIIFSDEKIFDTNYHGDRILWRHQLDARPRVFPLPRDGYPPKVQVWGAIGIDIKVLVFLPVDAGVDAASYIKNVLEPNAHILRNGVFMQDGARAHTSQHTMLALNRLRINPLVGWPPRSPDLNPIENLWHVLQQAVSARGPWGRQDLYKFIREEWDQLDQFMINQLVRSYRRRCEQCVERGGKLVD